KSYARAIITEEKLIDENNLRPIGFMERALHRARPVCLVEVAEFGSGTGFLIAPGIAMTNNHVIPSVEHASRTRLRFNYQLDEDGHLEPSSYFLANPMLFF